MHGSMLRRSLFLLLLAAVLLPGGGAGAASPEIGGAVRGDFARITFSWPQKVRFKTASAGKTLTVTFERRIAASPASLARSLAPYVQSAVLSPDGKSILLRTDKPYATRSFVSGNVAGLDLLGIDPARRREAPRAEAPPPPPAPPAVPPPAAIRMPPSIVQASPEPKEEPEEEYLVMEAHLAPAAGHAAAATPAAPSPAGNPAPPAESGDAPQEAGGDTLSAPPPATRASGTAPARAGTHPKAELTAATPRAKGSLMQGGRMIVAASNRQSTADLFFPWRERVAGAVFARGNRLWVIFSRPAAIDLTLLKGVLPPYITHVEQVPSPGNTVLLFRIDGVVSAEATKRKDDYEWIVSLSRRGRFPASPLATEVVSKPPLKPYVLVQILQTAPPLNIADPEVGDSLMVIPLYEAGQGVYPERRFVDFSLLGTAQGIAIEPRRDDLRAARTRTGLKISAPDGITVSENLPALDLESILRGQDTSHTFFPYDHWKTDDYYGFMERRQQLDRQISEATAQKADFLRTELAKLYLGAGMHHEALGMLDLIRRNDPKFYADYQLAALHGAANFMMERFQEAGADFNDPSLESEEEIGLWKRAIAVLSGRHKLMKFLAYDRKFAKFYPPAMRYKLGIISADQAITNKRYNMAFKIMDSLATEGGQKIRSDEIDYMVARVLTDAGKNKEAKAKLKKLIKRSKNRFILVRAKYALASLLYKDGDISRKQFIRRLDRLRLIWRGDAVELSILGVLGDLNIAEGEYGDALRAWKDIVTYYPGAQQAPDAAAKMAQAFIALFNEGKADTLKPLEALSLYYEFRELTPIGVAGDKMIQNLADRLAGVDLLGRAAELLRHQVKYRLEKEERSRIGARLALLYLLNREPREAQEALELTGYGDNPPDLLRERNHLAAQAYSATGEWGTSLAVLKDDHTKEGKQLRLNVYWENKDWARAAETAEDMLANRKDIAAPLSMEEARTLLRLGVAYTFLDDRTQLQYLRDYFTPLMKGNPLEERFRFLVSDADPLTPENLSNLAKDLGDMQSFLENYRVMVRKEGLSKAIQ